MGVRDFFRPVKTMTAEEVRHFLFEHDPEDFHLIDVRQPAEYLCGHLPGAWLVPLDQLEEKTAQADPDKPAITYCAAGARSRAAASILHRLGFREIYSMEGGIRAWHGAVAEGEPEAGRPWFTPAHTAQEYIALAWLLEEGTRCFYACIAERLDDLAQKSFYRQMAAAEEDHRAALRSLYQDLTGAPPGPRFPYDQLAGRAEERRLEGGVLLAEALEWSREKTAAEILQYAIGMEANAYDRYMLLLHETDLESARDVFHLLAEEERDHLRTLTRHLDRLL